MLETILLASTFTIGNITEEGIATKVCGEMSKGDFVIFDSNGGLVDEFLELGNCIYEKGINSIIIKARSAAAYAASAADKTCYYQNSEVGYHTPHHLIDKTVVELSVGQLREHHAKVSKYLNHWGIDFQTIVNINYSAMMTHPTLMFTLKGDDIKSMIKKSARCEDVIGGDD